MSIKRHLQRHGLIHALWAISVLLLLVAALLLGLPNGSLIGDYIAFAASIASLVLAVVAIFYSMISNQSFSEMVGQLRGSAETVRAAALQVCDVSSQLSDQSNRMLGEFSQLPPALKEISGKLDRTLAPSAEEKVAIPAQVDEAGRNMLDRMESGGAKIGLYALAMSSKTGIPIKIMALLGDAKWNSYLSGFYMALYSASPQIRLERIGEADDETFLVDDFGPLVPDEVIEWVASSGEFQKQKSEVDNYFRSDPHSQETKSKVDQ